MKQKNCQNTPKQVSVHPLPRRKKGWPLSTKKKTLFVLSSDYFPLPSEVQLRVILSRVDLRQWLIIKGVHLKLLGSMLGPTSDWLISFRRRVRLMAV